MTCTCCAELLPHISAGQSHPSLRNTNKKTTLFILSMSKIQPERDLNQYTTYSTLLNPLMTVTVLEYRPSCPAISRQHHYTNRQQSKEIQHPPKRTPPDRVVTPCRGVHGGRPTESSGQAATPAAKHLWGYSSTCHERTPSGPVKSVRTLQVAARDRDGWAGGTPNIIHLAILPTSITTSDIPNKYTHCHNCVCYSSKPKLNAT